MSKNEEKPPVSMYLGGAKIGTLNVSNGNQVINNHFNTTTQNIEHTVDASRKSAWEFLNGNKITNPFK